MFINGRTGVGKSTLIAFLVNEAETQAKVDDTVVLSFYFSRASPLQRSLGGLFRSLLHQLLCADNNLLDRFMNDTQYVKRCKASGEPGGKWDWEESSLRPLFEQYAKAAASTRKVYIFIDALDQCQDDSLKSLVDLLLRLKKCVLQWVWSGLGWAVLRSIFGPAS